MYLLLQAFQRCIQDRDEDLKLCKVSKEVSNGLWKIVQLRAHPDEVLGDLVGTEPEAEIQSLIELVELLAACSGVSASL